MQWQCACGWGAFSYIAEQPLNDTRDTFRRPSPGPARPRRPVSESRRTCVRRPALAPIRRGQRRVPRHRRQRGPRGSVPAAENRPRQRSLPGCVGRAAAVEWAGRPHRPPSGKRDQNRPGSGPVPGRGGGSGRIRRAARILRQAAAGKSAGPARGKSAGPGQRGRAGDFGAAPEPDDHGPPSSGALRAL